MSISVLVILILLNFYGLYTNKFYFFKFDNYIFPVLTVVHFIFLYALWFKITEREYPDPQMRNLEFSLYAIFFVYVFKFFDTLFILLSYTDFEEHVIPDTFIPVGVTMLVLYLFLVLMTLVTFKHRKEMVGSYNFENMNENIDSWQ